MEVLNSCDVPHLQTLLDRGERFWLALQSPSDDTLRDIGRLLGLNDLAIEDSMQFGQRPKIDDYPDSALLVFYGARTDGGGESLPVPVEVHFHITAKAVVTVRRHDLTPLEDARKRISLQDVDTSEEALYRVLDALASSFGDPLQAVERELDRIEDDLLDTSHPEVRRRLLDIKHSLVRLRHVVDPQRDVLAGHRDLLDQLPGFHDEGAHNILRDLYDRQSLTSQQLDSVREMVSNALDLYVSAVSNRLNEIMKVLTIVATFFLPLTFLTGFFGQNFEWMVGNVRSREAFLILGPGIAIAFVVFLLVMFVRAGFITLRWPGRPPAAGRRTASRRAP
ncbi:MAG: magnesium transporter CorA family protein [Thermoleophilia bacterium]|nr:magnesium transporter CorA family protein [Thermoleophilia bacterium]